MGLTDRFNMISQKGGKSNGTLATASFLDNISQLFQISFAINTVSFISCLKEILSNNISFKTVHEATIVKYQESCLQSLKYNLSQTFQTFLTGELISKV